MKHHRLESVTTAMKAAAETASADGLHGLELQAHVFLAAFDAANAAGVVPETDNIEPAATESGEAE
jgi:hypothetical protein